MMDLVLETPRCVLTPLARTDAAELHALWTTPGVRRFLWDDEIIPPARTDEALRKSAELFREHHFGLWAIRVNGSPALAGFAGVWPFRDPPEFELLYAIGEPWWGQGYAVEAARAVIDHCFGPLDLERMRASTDAANTASIRVLEKLGFKLARRDTVGGLDTMFFELPR